MAKQLGMKEIPRIVSRIEPKPPSHTTFSDRILDDEIERIGLDQILDKPLQIPENIIIFDDITTTGTSVNAVAALLYARGYEDCNYYSFCLGKTRG
jgi:adenine/guanine phosphoribosyltransferase-like PRPP-binding protein